MKTRSARVLMLFARSCRSIFSQRSGSVLVEFAIVANILIILNIFAYDFAGYFRLSEQMKHATQFIQTNLANDADHAVTKSDLQTEVTFLNAVTGLVDFNETGAAVITAAIPFFSSSENKWTLLVCWSWSSNPNIKAAHTAGNPLFQDDYNVEPWAPASGVAASLALVIVETYQKNPRLMDVSLVPEMTVQKFIGPVRNFNNQKLNLHLYDYLGGKSLNESKSTEPSPSKAVACQR